MEPIPHHDTAKASDDDAFRLLQLASRMLVEYNVRAMLLVGHLGALAARFGLGFQAMIAYCGATLYLRDGRTIHVQAHEYRINVAISSGVLRLLDAVTHGRMTPAAAIERMTALERAGPCHGRWVLALLFGLAGAALARILQADAGAIAISGLSCALGLLIRKELGKRHWPIFSLPFVAGLVGGVISGLAIRAGWTQTSGLCVLVPALVLVPGPQLINGLFEIIENHIHSGMCRLVLAAGILLATASGTIFGAWTVTDMSRLSPATASNLHLTLWLDMALAGVAACGFGAFYNAPWRVLWISIVSGMIGHGIRFLCLSEGAGLPAATLFACAAIGIIATIAVIRLRLPFASVAFAAAVPMMPGTLIYRSIGGAAYLARAGTSASPEVLTSIFVHLVQAFLVVGAMVIGLLLGAVVTSWAHRMVRPNASSNAGVTH